MNPEKRVSRLPPDPIPSKVLTFLNLKLVIGKRIWTKRSQINDDSRISQLPDAILCKILSFLDLQSAVCTCILSKRWKSLWTFIEHLDFDFDKFRSKTKIRHSSRHHRQEALLPYVRSEDGFLNFINPQHEAVLRFVYFVDGVLSNRDSSSRTGKFRLTFHNRITVDRITVDRIFVQNCVHYAASHDVQDLYLEAFHHRNPFRFPPNFMGSRSLQKLRLTYYYQNALIPKPFCFPNLKVLYLECFPFKDDDDFCFPKEPFSSFPNLEELTLDTCQVDGLIILAPELKVLEIQFRKMHKSFESRILKAATPKLESFKFGGQVSVICPFEELPCLDKVYVDHWFWKPQFNDEVKYTMAINLCKLFEQLKTVKTVTLSFKTIQVLLMDLNALQQYPSPFVNLMNLKFVGESREQQSGLPPQNVMAYLTDASSLGDSMIVEIPDTYYPIVHTIGTN